MKKRVNLKNRVSALGLSFFLALGLITPAFSITANAEAAEVLNSTTTVADIVMSYMASGGVVMTNTNFINSLYQTVGSEFGTLQTFVNDGLLTYSNGQYVDTGLSTSISSVVQNISGVDLNNLFNQTATQNPAGVALSGSASLAGIAGSVATTGILPVTAGVAVSGYCGFQIGTIISNMLQEFAPHIYQGIPIDMGDSYIFDQFPEGARTGVVKTSDRYSYRSGVNCVCVKYINSRGKYVYELYPYTGNNNAIKNLETNFLGEIKWNQSSTANKGNSAYQLTASNNYEVYNYYTFQNASEAYAFENGLSNGTITPDVVKSPDLIGSNGNLSAEHENGEYTVPDMLPQIDPSTQSVNPSGLSLEDWLRFANDAKGNYTSGNPELNTDIFNDILDAIRGIIPTPSPDPTPTPGGETYPVPGPVPDTTPVPDPEYQPETKPQPQYTEKPTENETDITEGDPWTTPDLLDKFPFCIPRDVYRVFTKLDSGARSAPHIQWRFNPNNKIDYTFDIDFSEWDAVATLLRTLELLGFIVALAVATRKMILS